MVGCMQNTQEEQSVLEPTVDDLHLLIEKNTLNFRSVLTLDHHRMAQTEGAYTPPAIASIFIVDHKDFYKVLEVNQELAMDLPFKILAYNNQEQEGPFWTYTSAEFLSTRHGVDLNSLRFFSKTIETATNKLPKSQLITGYEEPLTKGYGIVSITSDYDYEETVARFRQMILSNQDARWFGEIDFQKEAKNFSVDISPTFLAFFGAPKPGALAMHDAPRIGLDAFCQKVLIYKTKDNKVLVKFSDMAAFGNLYYGKSNMGQKVVTQRVKEGLTATLVQNK